MLKSIPTIKSKCKSFLFRLNYKQLAAFFYLSNFADTLPTINWLYFPTAFDIGYLDYFQTTIDNFLLWKEQYTSSAAGNIFVRVGR